ncbi:unnamed protein product, partial [Litomosoides sigmodontis]
MRSLSPKVSQVVWILPVFMSPSMAKRPGRAAAHSMSTPVVG